MRILDMRVLLVTLLGVVAGYGWALSPQPEPPDRPAGAVLRVVRDKPVYYSDQAKAPRPSAVVGAKREEGQGQAAPSTPSSRRARR